MRVDHWQVEARGLSSSSTLFQWHGLPLCPCMGIQNERRERLWKWKEVEGRRVNVKWCWCAEAICFSFVDEAEKGRSSSRLSFQPLGKHWGRQK